MESIILKNMLKSRKLDMEMLKVPYDHDKKLLDELNGFIAKESDYLVDDSKQIDIIRVFNIFI
jgi:hypothetical protein